MARKFHTFDVFTEERLAGNALAIVEDGEGLESQAMQKIAREFNLSETVFLLPPDNKAHSAKVRIFTPGQELPFAGHPSVGTAIFLAMQKLGDVSQEEDAIIVLEEEVGPVRCGVRLRPDEAPFAEFDMPVLPSEVGEAAPRDVIATALGLEREEISFENHVPTVYSAGNPFTFVPVRNLEVIGRARIAAQHWDSVFHPETHPAAFVYTRETIAHDAAFHARMFWPAIGIGEDPATGSAAAAFAAVIMRFDELRDGTYIGTIEQGYEMGRPSQMV
ncbi:MAG: PhzF family phenazine biosynthesis protein, partial [Hyphomicrobiales bacterium]|nr:PhzF family phenazine biosynthesis protein [Hyphomicrobiales bacterium]